MPRGLAPVRLLLADQVAEHILGAIARGDYAPDSQLAPEADLAESCGVSRLTLREAIKALREKGVVRVEPGRGTFVNPMSMWPPLNPTLLSARLAESTGGIDLAFQLTEARRAVEMGVVELAAARRDEADLDLLGRKLSLMRDRHEKDDADGFAAADIDFHNAVISAAGNVFLGALFEPIAVLIRQVQHRTSAVVEAREIGLGLHVAIFDAIADANPDQAKTAMIQHFRHTDMTVKRALDPDVP
jgi:DNA-binding FadR family transcriptional regulator